MNGQQTSPSLKAQDIASQLYTIRNIANLAVMCPQKDAEVYVLQDVMEHISGMIQGLIEHLEQQF